MAKLYKVINLNRQNIAPQVIPEQGWKLILENEQLSKVMKNLGECDAGGNLLTDLSKNNFLAKEPEILDSAFVEQNLQPELQTFNDGKETNTGGTGDQIKAGTAGKSNTGKKPGKGK